MLRGLGALGQSAQAVVGRVPLRPPPTPTEEDEGEEEKPWDEEGDATEGEENDEETPPPAAAGGGSSGLARLALKGAGGASPELAALRTPPVHQARPRVAMAPPPVAVVPTPPGGAWLAGALGTPRAAVWEPSAWRESGAQTGGRRGTS